jgi:hypothetical protein
MAREICEIWSTRSDEHGEIIQELAGTFILDNGKLTYTSEKRSPAYMQGLMRETAVVDRGRREVTAQEEPAVWFHALPTMYRGVYVRAQMVS